MPSSITGFAHRRSRADSTPSFTYFQQNDESPEWTEEEAIVDHSNEEADDINDPADGNSISLSQPMKRQRKSSAYSRVSAEDPLLRRHSSSRTEVSSFGRTGRLNQKIYILTEDLTIVVSGFRTTRLGLALYIALCFLSIGFAYLLLRWLPRWRVLLTGTACPLRECTWVVIEVSQLFIYEANAKFG